VNKINKLTRFLRGKIDGIIYILMGGHVRFFKSVWFVEQKVCLMVRIKKRLRSATLILKEVFTCTGYGRAEPCFLKNGLRGSAP